MWELDNMPDAIRSFEVYRAHKPSILRKVSGGFRNSHALAEASTTYFFRVKKSVLQLKNQESAAFGCRVFGLGIRGSGF